MQVLIFHRAISRLWNTPTPQKFVCRRQIFENFGFSNNLGIRSESSHWAFIGFAISSMKVSRSNFLKKRRKGHIGIIRNPLYYVKNIENARIPIITYHLPIKVYIWFVLCLYFFDSLWKVIRKKKKKMESPLVIRIDKNEFKPGRSITQDGGAGERIRYPLTNLDAISKGVLRLLFTIQFYRFTLDLPCLSLKIFSFR